MWVVEFLSCFPVFFTFYKVRSYLLMCTFSQSTSMVWRAYLAPQLLSHFQDLPIKCFLVSWSVSCPKENHNLSLRELLASSIYFLFFQVFYLLTTPLSLGIFTLHSKLSQFSLAVKLIFFTARLALALLLC